MTPILWHTLASRLFVSHASAHRLLQFAIWGAVSALATAPLLIQAFGGFGALAAALLGYLLQGVLVSWAIAGIVAVRRRYILVQLLGFLVLAMLTGGTVAGVLQATTTIPALVLVALLASAGTMAELSSARRGQ